MGIFNASPVSADVARDKFGFVFRQDEVVDFAFKTIRDYVMFTNKRLVTTNAQGLTGSKVEYASYPYRSITSFSVETAGTFDLDCEVKISVSGRSPLELQLSRGSNVTELQRFLAERII